MARLFETFTRDDDAVNQSIPVPEGWYSAKITDANIKTTKAGNGQYIAVRYDILGPTHQGRVVFGNFNIKNPSQMAEAIGRKELSKMLMAIGVTQLTDTDQLLGHDLSIKLSIKKSEEYGDSNEVKDYKSLNAQPMPQASAPAQAQQAVAAPQADAAAPPWASR